MKPTGNEAHIRTRISAQTPGSPVEMFRTPIPGFCEPAFRQYIPAPNRIVTAMPEYCLFLNQSWNFETLAAIHAGKISNYQTDLFIPIFEQIEKDSKTKYSDKSISYSIVADHIRALSFAISDGAFLSNEGRGYILRKILI